MKLTRILMGMPITVEIADFSADMVAIEKVFDYFEYVDKTFSTYNPDSEISRINMGKINRRKWSSDMKEVFRLSEKTKQETAGYFDIYRQGSYDPAGLVKGWAVYKAASILEKEGYTDYFIEAGGDIQVNGKNSRGELWSVGIRNPFNSGQIIKAVHLDNKGIATSGTYVRGQHVYNPHEPYKKLTDIVSLTVIGPNIYDADRYATAAFAMQKNGIAFIENLNGFEGYMIDADGIATYTSGFTNYAYT